MELLEESRKRIATCMDCEPMEVYFTSTATEAAAMVLASAHHAMYRIILSPYEHHAVAENVWSRPLAEYVENPIGALWCRMYGNNETGDIAPRPKMRQKDLLLRDATATVGHVPVSFKKLGADYLIADAIKFGGVSGAAFLIAKKGAPLSPLIRGGGQERGMRSGTENVPAICAMAAALEWQTEHMEENTQKIAAMRQMLFQSISRIENHKWNTPFEKPCLPHILNVSFDGVDGHALALLLSKEGVMVSAGAACSNGKNEPSHVLMAMFNDESRARSAIRISLSHDNTPDECVEAAGKIAECVKYLRSMC
jgi:cysteine desulfurase